MKSMRFASIGHLMTSDQLDQIPQEWKHEKYILSPKISFNDTVGYLLGLKITAKEIISLPKNIIREHILNASLYLQKNYDIELLQLGALTTSVTKGGIWLTKQLEYTGFVNHGNTYTAAVACDAVEKMVEKYEINTEQLQLAIVGAYGIIGEAISKKLSSKFKHTILVGRKEEKLNELMNRLDGNISILTNLKINTADFVITATNHPSALLTSEHLKKGVYVLDIAQPCNVSLDLCQERSDIHRIDGGYVSIPESFQVAIPGYPEGKIFSCIAEVIMQAMENDRSNHVGSIDMHYLNLTKKWANTYGFTLNELTNFGKPVP